MNSLKEQIDPTNIKVCISLYSLPLYFKLFSPVYECYSSDLISK